MKRYKQILLYVVSTMSSIYNCCDRWHVKWIIKKLIVSVQNFWYDPRIFECKVWTKSVQIYSFWVPWSSFCMYHLMLFAVNSSFSLYLPKFFWWPFSFFKNFFCTTLYFLFIYSPKKFFYPPKIFFAPLNIFLHPGNFYTPPKSFFYHLNFSQPPLIFIALPL